MKITKMILLTAMLIVPAVATAGDATIKLPSANGADAFVVQDKYGSSLMRVDSAGNINVKNLSVSEPSSIGNMHLFISSGVVPLWDGKATQTDGLAGGPYTTDVYAYVPVSAKGAILKVIVNGKGRNMGTFALADRQGNFCTVLHYLCNGFTNYSPFWTGGVVYAPFITGTKTFKWQMSSYVVTAGVAANRVDNTVSSYGTLIGWF